MMQANAYYDVTLFVFRDYWNVKIIKYNSIRLYVIQVYIWEICSFIVAITILKLPIKYYSVVLYWMKYNDKYPRLYYTLAYSAK